MAISYIIISYIIMYNTLTTSFHSKQDAMSEKKKRGTLREQKDHKLCTTTLGGWEREGKSQQFPIASWVTQSP